MEKMLKILVVDDDEHWRRIMQEELGDEGYEVIIAEHGQKGLDLFKEKKPDLVTLDILLPDIDGIRVLKEMKRHQPKTPIIMSSAYDYRDDFAIWASEAYIVKSSDLTELLGMIRRLLSGGINCKLK